MKRLLLILFTLFCSVSCEKSPPEDPPRIPQSVFEKLPKSIYAPNISIHKEKIVIYDKGGKWVLLKSNEEGELVGSLEEILKVSAGDIRSCYLLVSTAAKLSDIIKLFKHFGPTSDLFFFGANNRSSAIIVEPKYSFEGLGEDLEIDMMHIRLNAKDVVLNDEMIDDFYESQSLPVLKDRLEIYSEAALLVNSQPAISVGVDSDVQYQDFISVLGLLQSESIDIRKVSLFSEEDALIDKKKTRSSLTTPK